MIRLFEIKIKVGQSEDCLNQAVFKKLGKLSGKIDGETIRISGKSIDARDKNNIRFIYNVDFQLKEQSADESAFVSKVQKYNKKTKIKVVDDNIYNPLVLSDEKTGSKKAENEIKRPVVVGFGPSGMFAALYLALNGLKPIVIERGKTVEKRVSDVARFWKDGTFNAESNPLYGEGGAGTFSDGKLTTGKNDIRIPYILDTFYKAGSPEEILYARNPHIGTDVLRVVVKNIREHIIMLGGEIHFNTKLTSITTETCDSEQRLKSVGVTEHNDENQNSISNTDTDINKSLMETEIETDDLILAIGHSARDTYKVLNDQGLAMEQKPFSIGLRIEHDQNLIDQSQYGENFQDIYKVSLREGGMPPAEYKLSHRLENGRGVYTFCMCPGGHVITTSAEEGTISVNGMSNHKRDGKNANSAILVDVRTEDYESDEPLSGIDFQRRFEMKAFAAGGSKYKPPEEPVSQFLSNESLLYKCLPEFAAEGIREALPVFGRKIKGFDSPDAVLKGIESGSSSPVRINRDKNFMSNIKNIYPGGEGAGYAGGITSSAIDGLKCAEAVCQKYK